MGVVSILCGLLGAFDDGGDALALILVGAGAAAVGLAARRSFERRHRPAPGRVLSGLALAWLFLVLLGASLYLMTGTTDRVDDALLESASGFSTVSMTALDPATLTVPMQLFRAATQWIGGLLGIIVGVVSLPLALRSASTQGATSHAAERLAPTVVVGRRRVMAVYAAFTVVLGVAYAIAGLGARDSLVHAFTTISTGGFSSHSDSFVTLGAGPRAIATVGMLLGGTSFVVIWWAIRGRTRTVWRSTELRLYLGLFAAGSILISLGEHDATLGESAFTAASAVSTTGFAVGDWSVASDAVLMVMLVLIGTGSMSASAGGGLHVIRAWTLVGFASRELRRQLDSAAVVVVKQAGRPIDEKSLERTTGYQIGHLALCGVAAFLLAAAGLDVLGAVYTGISVISTHGPGVGPGPFGDVSGFSATAKLVMIPFMLAGRLSILPLLLAVSWTFKLEKDANRRLRRGVARLVSR